MMAIHRGDTIYFRDGLVERPGTVVKLNGSTVFVQFVNGNNERAHRWLRRGFVWIKPAEKVSA